LCLAGLLNEIMQGMTSYGLRLQLSSVSCSQFFGSTIGLDTNGFPHYD